MKVLIVGLGLIGGSLAKQLKKNSDWYVLGYDINSEVCSEALKSKAIDEIWNYEKTDLDITILCLSPEKSIDFLKTNAHLLKENSVVSDVCGIKQMVVSECEKICTDNNLYFVGGHPMAGKERSGFKNSDENLFNRASYILTQTDNTDENALNMMKQFISNLKAAKITITTPEIHDRMIAFTSQIPHIIAGAYVKSPSCLNRHGFSAGSFKDCSRVATVDEALWSELFLNNREILISELDYLLNNLNKYKTALLDNDKDSLVKIIKEGRVIKEADLKESKGDM